MYIYRKEHLLGHFNQILKQGMSQDASDWMSEKTFRVMDQDTSAFYMAFTSVPRRVGKALVSVTTETKEAISEILPGFSLDGYTTDRLARLILLLNWPVENKERYIQSVGQLFKAAEMNELVALYGALPLLAYPEEWVEQCKEGIRSNIGSVLETIICDNPYPAHYLPEGAWNQLILKAFFTEKPIERIIGLDHRSNKSLAYTLSDYAHERWAASRTFDLQLWRIVAKFIDERIYPDIRKVFGEGNEYEKKAAALACTQSNYPPAKALMDESPDLKKEIETNKLNWETLIRAYKAYSEAGNKI